MTIRLPIGISDFATLIKEDYTFIDKSLFIKDIIDDGAKIILLTRPRRFGKTLNMSMLKYFFSNDIKPDIKKDLFTGLNIKNTGEKYLQHQGKYPVVYLTFKDVKVSNYADAYAWLEKIISQLYSEYQEVLNEDFLKQEDKKVYQALLNGEATKVDLCNSLKNLSKYLYLYYGVKPIILLDEYDTPIQTAYMNNYYDEMVEFMRGFLGAALKDNECLYKAVITGILRVSQASLFSGLNNIAVYSLLRSDYGQYFGFIEEEVNSLLSLMHLDVSAQSIRNWYNGYTVGEYTVYNPWSIISCLKQKGELQPYWLATSDNKLLGKLLVQADGGIKGDFEKLLQGETVEKIIDESTVFLSLEKKHDALWGLLLFSGYLKVVETKMVGINKICSLALPNIEVSGVYLNLITEWFTDSIGWSNYKLFLSSLITGNIDLFGRILQEYMYESSSYFDFGRKATEQMYHVFILGLIVGLRDKYYIKSNSEIGTGRCDVLLIPKNKKQLGLVVEFKNAKEEDKLQQSVTEALQQIKDRRYDVELHQQGVKDILHVGIAFAGKKTLVASH